MKKRSLAILLTAVLVFAVVFVFLGQDQKGDGQGEIVPESQVTDAIQTFSKLVTAENVQTFGLKSIDQLKSLKPGQQFKKYMIGLDDLKKYAAGANVETLIKEYPSIEVALVDGSGKIQTSIEFVKNNNKWEKAGFGTTPDFTSLKNSQDIIPADSVKNARLIRIPSLKSSFLAVTSAGTLNFIPLEDVDRLGFKRGAALPAIDVIQKLVPVANEYNGLPD